MTKSPDENLGSEVQSARGHSPLWARVGRSSPWKRVEEESGSGQPGIGCALTRDKVTKTQRHAQGPPPATAHLPGHPSPAPATIQVAPPTGHVQSLTTISVHL